MQMPRSTSVTMNHASVLSATHQEDQVRRTRSHVIEAIVQGDSEFSDMCPLLTALAMTFLWQPCWMGLLSWMLLFFLLVCPSSAQQPYSLFIIIISVYSVFISSSCPNILNIRIVNSVWYLINVASLKSFPCFYFSWIYHLYY